MVDVEPGDVVGELGTLMGQPAFLAGVAMPEATLLRAPGHRDLRGVRRLLLSAVGPAPSQTAWVRRAVTGLDTIVSGGRRSTA